jgi:hypothetical protein
MRDHIIRAIFHQTVLSKEHLDDNTIVIDELGLQNGLIRADIVVLNGCMVGYEIKTQNDNLNRLPAQVAAYSEIFDKAYIIVAAKHLAKALTILPEWWGVYVITCDEDAGYAFENYRVASRNDRRDIISIARLLWKDEVSEILIGHSGKSVSKSRNKQQLYELIAEKYTPEQFGPIVLTYIKQRSGWRKDRALLS